MLSSLLLCFSSVRFRLSDPFSSSLFVCSYAVVFLAWLALREGGPCKDPDFGLSARLEGGDPAVATTTELPEGESLVLRSSPVAVGFQRSIETFVRVRR